MALQYLRKIGLTVSGSAGQRDFSTLRVVFHVEQQTRQTPNIAEISIYNVSRQTAQQFIDKEFTKVTLTAGYEGNPGVIFKGNIKFSRFGQETPVDKRLDIFCGDGDEPYVHAVTNKALPSGWTHKDVVDAALEPMKAFGVTMGYVAGLPTTKFNGPRILFSNARDILRDTARATKTEWSIQNGQLQVLPYDGTLPGSEIILNSDTGLIGLPVQTPGGIVVRSLLNPIVMPGRVIRINNGSIQRASPDLSISGELTNAKLPSIDADGRYKVIVVNRIGDTHGGPGGPWFNEMTCLSADGRGYVPQNLRQYVPQ
ncbi:hypothetical protein LOK46_10565 [Methylobacterium sp. NMS14P]|uniref:phage protein n=1 Tax=Methylobacterium sp. NMS14P TaxID=2894310 RepID=UPI0023595F04|nr:hypothetical protein [Methylobacterium sp. NMS14P]WCS27232.1 hypothetical protein LOK46_10565 [Methylobacterium sp. NMS14P]